ncbi:hypothetical protein Gotur_030439 [Gossypium turneri]
MFNYHYMLKYDDTDSRNASNFENTELFKNQSDEKKLQQIRMKT